MLAGQRPIDVLRGLFIDFPRRRRLQMLGDTQIPSYRAHTPRRCKGSVANSVHSPIIPKDARCCSLITEQRCTGGVLPQAIVRVRVSIRCECACDFETSSHFTHHGSEVRSHTNPHIISPQFENSPVRCPSGLCEQHTQRTRPVQICWLLAIMSGRDASRACSTFSDAAQHRDSHRPW